MPIESIEDHLVGHAEIDADHRGLVRTINRIGEDIDEGSYALCIELFDELESAALRHFEREEAILGRLAFPGLERHRTYHATLIRRVRELKALGYEKAAKELLFERFVAMADFVVDDIIRGDLEFADFLRG